MGGFSIFMIIFGIVLFLFGLYMATGHDVRSLLWTAPYKHLTKQGFIQLGKWVMVSSVIPFLLAIIGVIFAW